MTRDVRYDPDTGRYLDYPPAGNAPPPGWIEAQEADFAALPIARVVEDAGVKVILCPTCAEGSPSYVVEEDGTFGARTCEECDQEIRAQ